MYNKLKRLRQKLKCPFLALCYNRVLLYAEQTFEFIDSLQFFVKYISIHVKNIFSADFFKA